MSYKDLREAVLIRREIVKLIKKHEGCKSMFISILIPYVGIESANDIINRLEVKCKN